MTENQIEIIKEFAHQGMNVSKTARSLRYHRNSIVYHLDKILDDTDFDPRNFYDLVKLLRMAGEDI